MFKVRKTPMERDYLGSASKNVPVSTKEDATDASKDSVPNRSPGMQWSSGNKVSAVPQFLSFKATSEEKPMKTVHDPIKSSGFGPFATADAFHSKHKPYSSIIQKNMNLDEQSGNHHAMTSYSRQHFDSYPVYQPQEMRRFPLSSQHNQIITFSMSTPALHSHFASTGNSVVGSSINSQPLGGVPMISPVSVCPTTCPIIGTTDLRESAKYSGGPSQLTIFYGGSVCVYDDVSAEKAQAIMLLAGNGSSGPQGEVHSAVQICAQIPRPRVDDAHVGKKIITPSCIGLPSPISVPSRGANELATVKPVGALAASANQTEPPKHVSSVGPASATLMPAVAVPQARKASLARFLEKRKERLTNTTPYNVIKKLPDPSDAPGSDGLSSSINTSRCFHLPANN